MNRAGLSFYQFIFICGGILYGLLFQNVWLALVLAILGYLLEGQLRILSDRRAAKNFNEALRVALGILTGAYIQSNDIVKAVRENVERLPDPVRPIFQQFTVETHFIAADIEGAILNLQHAAENRFLKEWCDCMLQCQHDRTLKYILITITEKMLDVKKAQEELDSLMFLAYRDFIAVVLVAVMSLPAMWVFNREWFVLLIQNNIGRLVTAILYLAVGISSVYAIRINQPVMIK